MAFTRRQFVQSTTALALSSMYGAVKAEGAWKAKKPIRLIVPYTAGGPTDAIARALGQQVGNDLGQPVIVENRPGASGAIGARAVWAAEPDGHTILVGASDTNCIYPHVYTKPIFKAEELIAFSPVGYIPHVLMARPDLPADSIKELLELSKKQKLTYASWGVGSTGNLAMVLFMQSLGLSGDSFLHVPYPGAAPAAQAVLAKQVDVIFAPVPMVIAQGEKLKALAVIGEKRVSAIPKVPTFAEQGVKFSTDAEIWIGLMLPPKTPKEIVTTLSAKFNEATAAPAIQKRMLEFGITPPQRMNSEEYKAWYLSQYSKWGKVIGDAGIKMDGAG